MNVYVLICESIYDMGDQNLSCAVFDSIEKAKEQLKKEVDDAMHEYDAINIDDYNYEEDGVYVADIYDMGASIYPYGRYSETHIVLEIQEKKIM